MRIDAATPEDSRAIAEVHVASWQSAYRSIVSASYLAALSIEDREATLQKQLREGSPRILVARDASRVVGFVTFDASRDAHAPSSVGEIWALYVLPDHWSTGAGRALWLAARDALLEQGFTGITHWALLLNERGMTFYKAAGFAIELGSETLFDLGDRQVAEVRLGWFMAPTRTTGRPPALLAKRSVVRGVDHDGAATASKLRVGH